MGEILPALLLESDLSQPPSHASSPPTSYKTESKQSTTKALLTSIHKITRTCRETSVSTPTSFLLSARSSLLKLNVPVFWFASDFFDSSLRGSLFVRNEKKNLYVNLQVQEGPKSEDLLQGFLYGPATSRSSSGLNPINCWYWRFSKLLAFQFPNTVKIVKHNPCELIRKIRWPPSWLMEKEIPSTLGQYFWFLAISTLHRERRALPNWRKWYKKFRAYFANKNMHTSDFGFLPTDCIVADGVRRKGLSLYVLSGVFAILLLGFFCESSAISRGTFFLTRTTEGLDSGLSLLGLSSTASAT